MDRDTGARFLPHLDARSDDDKKVLFGVSLKPPTSQLILSKPIKHKIGRDKKKE